MKKIILTGGGTAGHVTPNLALVPRLSALNYEILYIGRKEGIEKKLCLKEGLSYRGISSGKLRRYFDLKNLTDPFRVVKGYFEAKKIIREFQSDIIFSKGGFVSVPVVYAAKRLRVPIIIHESDMTPGLANRLSIPLADKVCCNFPETLKNLPEEKSILSGLPIREDLFKGSKKRGLELFKFKGDKPVLLVMGGSLGSQNINRIVRKILDDLLKMFDIVHLTGVGNVDKKLDEKSGYAQLEYANEELKDIYALTDLCISRAGANAICEILTLNIPSLLIPLSLGASRGDQILNAASFKSQGFCEVLSEDDMDEKTFLNKVISSWENREKFKEKMKNSSQRDAVKVITDLIEEIVNGETDDFSKSCKL